MEGSSREDILKAIYAYIHSNPLLPHAADTVEGIDTHAKLEPSISASNKEQHHEQERLSKVSED